MVDELIRINEGGAVVAEAAADKKSDCFRVALALLRTNAVPLSRPVILIDSTVTTAECASNISPTISKG